MIQYVELLQDIISHGELRPTRAKLPSTGKVVGAHSVFGRQVRFDLSKGFPLMTTKRVPFKAIKIELLWFLRGETHIKYLKEHGVSIWDEWILPDSQVGLPSEKRLIIAVERRIKEKPSGDGPSIKTGGYGIPQTNENKKLLSAWVHMMERCYDPEHHRYEFYGAKGVFVDQRWHDPVAFLRDVKLLPNWKHKIAYWNEYELDKDYYGSNCYSPDTCVWLHTSENNFYTSAATPFKVTYPDGTFEILLTLEHGERVLDISRSTLHRILTGQQQVDTLKGNNKKAVAWKFERLPPDKNWRMAFSKGELGPIYGNQWRSWGGVGIDQIAQVIEGIKRDPYGRRHIVSAWNVADVSKMALPPCHLLFQFYVSGGRLSCQLYQRSADVFLGVPFNIASYALLTCMIAQVCGLLPGEFIHTFGDVHLYENHMGVAQTQLARTPGALPRLVLAPGITQIDAFKPTDILIEGYEPQSALPAEVAV